MRSIRLLTMMATNVFVSPAAHAGNATEIPSAFSIAKSGNKNEVHYAVRVDETCNPSRSAPVRPYWRMLERSKDAVEPLSSTEERAFGVQRQDVDGDSVHLVLRGLPSRTITIRTTRNGDGGCDSTASMSVAGTSARIAGVFVKQSLFGVSYIQVDGQSANGELVRERIKP